MKVGLRTTMARIAIFPVARQLADPDKGTAMDNLIKTVVQPKTGA